MSFLLSMSLTLRRRTVMMVFLLWFSKLVLPSLHPSLVNYFVFVFLLQPSLLVGNVLKKGVPSQPSYYHSMSLTSVLSKVNLSLTGRFVNISILLILFLIANMSLIRNAQMVIFFRFSLTLG